MRRLFIGLLLLMVMGSLAQAQTTVNLTVKDTPDNQTWNSGTWSVQLIPGPGSLDQTRSFTLLSGGGSLSNQNGSLSATGTASMSLPANANIGPVGTIWQYTVCSQQGTACSIANITVTTSSPQTLNINPPSIRVASQPNLPPILVYTTTEISSAAIGSQITVVGSASGGTPTLQSCTAVSGSTCTSWSAAGGLPGQFSVKTYGAIGDAKHSNACTFNASTTLTCTDNPFASSDVTKLIFCVYPGTPSNETPAGTKITAFTSTSTVTISNAQFNGSAVTGGCTWATQDDTAAFQAALTAASVTTSISPNFGSPTLAYPGAVYVPTGGYMVSGNIFDFNAASGNTLAPSFIGAGSSSVVIYPRSDTFTAGARACLMDAVQGANFTWSGFLIWGSQWGFNCGGASIPFMRINVGSYFTLRDITINGVGATNSSTFILNLIQAQNGYLNQVNMQGTSVNNNGTVLFEMDNSAGILIEQSFFSNNTNGSNMIFNASGARNASGQQVSMVSGGSDECGGGATVDCVIAKNASFINMSGGSVFGEPSGAGNGALFVDGTSGVYLSSMNVGPFSTSTNSNGIAIASGGFVYATGSHIRGGGTTGSVIDGPAGAIFVDDGGNTYQRCLNTTCTNITGTTYAGAFTSGIIPATSLTHTYPQPFLPALPASGTAQNIVAFTPSNSITVKNFSITASNTPTCATPPTFQISNGTQSFTQTFASSAQISGPFTPAATLFPAGTQVTLSITSAAYACATAPTNMNWSIEWQSAVSF